MNELIKKLEVALAGRNPYLVQSLQPGLSAETIEKELQRAGITGAVEPLIELYSWRDGTKLHEQSKAFNAAIQAGFVPPKVVPLNEGQKEFLRQYGIKREEDKIPLHFLPLKSAILYRKDYLAAARKQPGQAPLTGRYFPFLWDGSSGHIAVDLDPACHNQVVSLQTILAKDLHPVREAYPSFKAFLEDAIRANEKAELLSCVQTAGQPIALAP